MRIASALRPSAAEQGVSSRHRSTRREAPRRLAPLAAALVASSSLAGCSLDLDDQRYASMKPMLVRQASPKCEYRTPRRQGDGQAATPEAELALLRAKLDYERQCYRHAEIIARNRLRSLQKAVEKTAKAEKAEKAANAAKAPEVNLPPQP
jgi:hypothetical protein